MGDPRLCTGLRFCLQGRPTRGPAAPAMSPARSRPARRAGRGLPPAAAAGAAGSAAAPRWVGSPQASTQPRLPAPAPIPAYPLALAGVLVGVVLQRQLAVGALDLLGGGIGLNLQDVVVLRLLHHGGCLWEDAPRYPRVAPALPRPAPRRGLTGRTHQRSHSAADNTATAAARSPIPAVPPLPQALYRLRPNLLE